MYRLLLLLLVGTISAQEPEDCPQDDLNNITDPDGEEKDCDMTGALETTPVDDSQLKLCDNVNVEVKKGYQVFNCPITFARAQCICRCLRGNLSSVHSLRENNQVRGVLQRACPNQKYVWIGMWKPGFRAPVNVDGSRIDYTNFARQRFTYLPFRMWCVAMNLSNGLWQSFNCWKSLPFVCTIPE